MAFEFIPDGEQGDERKRKTKIIISISFVFATLLSCIIFKEDIASLVGNAIYNNFNKSSAIPLLVFSSNGGNTSDMILLSNFVDDSNVDNRKTGKLWLEHLSNDGYAPANYKLGNLYKNGQAGYPIDFIRAADYYSKAYSVSDNPDVVKDSGDFLIKFYLSSPNNSELDIASNDENRVLFARQYLEKQFQKGDYSNAFLFSKSYLNTTPQDMNKEESLKKAIDILIVGIKNGQSLNGNLGDTYVKLYNITADKTYLFAAINAFSLAVKDPKDGYYKVSAENIDKLSSILRGS